MKEESQKPDVKTLTDDELAERLKHYRLYCVSNAGDKNASVISGPDMLKEVIRRLTSNPVPGHFPDTAPNKLDII